MRREVCLFGSPVGQSLSPAMQNAAFAATRIDCRYRTFETADARQAIDHLRSDPEILGANVTIPLKQSVRPLLDRVDELAGRLGAVNTIFRQRAELIGANTDVIGFKVALEECRYQVSGRSVLLVGAGGAARAIAEVLRPQVGRLVVLARREDQALGLIEAVGVLNAQVLPFEQIVESVQAADLVVNATPIDIPLAASLRRQHRLFDLRSRHSEEGLAMLLHQGAASFEIWTGQPAPLEAMRHALKSARQAVTA